MSNHTITIISPETFIPCELHRFIRTHEKRHASLMTEIKLKGKYLSIYSCDGLELASACSVGVLPMGKEILVRHVNNKNYNKQKDAAEFGDRVPGIYFVISNVLLLSFIITLLLLID